MAKRKVAPHKTALRARQGEAGPARTPAHGREHAPAAVLSQGTKETIAVTVRLDAERYRNEYFEATFSDTISIYLLSLYLDMDYYDLRERDYPLLAPAALAERLRKVAEMFPPNPGFDFAILYKRRA